MTKKKWDLETSNAETELKIGIYAKNWAKQVRLKNFDYGQSQWSTVKVNGQSQRSTADVAVWRHLGLTWQEERAAASTCGAWVRVTGACGLMRRVAGTSGACRCVAARAREAETSGGAWRHVWCSFWPFLVGFCSGLAVLSFYACCLAVECTERWYPSVAGTVGMTAVARFWQWRLDEGEGSGRTPEMSTWTKKSEEWLWYHVNNIKWERKTE